MNHPNTGGWLTRTEVARAFDVSVRTFDRSLRNLVGPEHVHREGRRVFFYARAIIEAWSTRRAGKRRSVSPVSEKQLADELLLDQIEQGFPT